MRKPTKADLANELAALRTENSMLRAQIEAMRAPKPAPHVDANPRFPDVDHRGRICRIERIGGREVRSYPA